MINVIDWLVVGVLTSIGGIGLFLTINRMGELWKRMYTNGFVNHDSGEGDRK